MNATTTLTKYSFPRDKKSIFALAVYSFKKCGVFVACLGVVLAVYGVWSCVRYGNLHHGVSYLQGHVIVANPADLGHVPTESVEECSFILTNLTNADVRIIGAQPSCPCASLKGLPLSIGPFGHNEIQVEVKTPNATTKESMKVTILLHIEGSTSVEVQPTLVLQAVVLPQEYWQHQSSSFDLTPVKEKML